MARKIDALGEIIQVFDGTLTADMSVADCIHEIAKLVAGFVTTSNQVVISFDARIKALEDKG